MSGAPTRAWTDAAREEQDGIGEFLGVLRRRKLALLLPVLLTPLLAVTYSLLQQPLYSASADVLVTSGSVGATLSELPGLSSPDEPERNARTQVELARLPRVAQEVIDAAPIDEDPATFLGRSSVSTQPDADILRFTVEDGDPEQAKRLATLYVGAFTDYRNALDIRAIRSTKQATSLALARLAARGEPSPAVLTELRRALSQLEAAEAFQGSSAILVQPAVSAEQVAPRTARNLVLALLLGIIVGVGLAFLAERLDTSIRRADEVAAIVGLPLLGEIPSPPVLPEARLSSVSMLELPHGVYAEAIRKLRANLEFANLDVGARTLLVTSVVDGEGKTTVACDLAVALARSGRTVALCDLDSRAPSVDRMFHLGDRRGLVEVAFGVESLERALVAIQWPTATSVLGGRADQPASGNGDGDPERPEAVASLTFERARGRLDVLPIGRRTPPNAGDFVGTETVRKLVRDLSQTHDVVIIDAPPLLPVSDALTISEYVDAALVVCGLRTSKGPALVRVRKLTEVIPAHLLGVVVTGVPGEPGYGPDFVRGLESPDAVAPRPVEEVRS